MEESGYNPEVAILRKGPISFYHQPSILNQDICWFRDKGYKIYSAESDRWNSVAQFHRSISTILEFPDYYGSNMNAFEDSLCELNIDGHKGALIVLLKFDVFAKKFPEESFIILDIIANISRLYLIDGIKLIALVQTDDLNLSFPPVGCFSIAFNAREP